MRNSLIWIFFSILTAAFISCSSNKEFKSRIAVRGLATAPDNKVDQQMERVLALGTYVLPDIEQEFEGASLKGRRRLLDAIEKLGSAEVIPLLEHLQRWDPEKTIRDRARRLVRAFKRDITPKKP